MKLWKGYIKKPFLLLVNEATLPSDNPLKYRENFL